LILMDNLLRSRIRIALRVIIASILLAKAQFSYSSFRTPSVKYTCVEFTSKSNSEIRIKITSQLEG
jgi:hypothetical protein